MLDQAAAAPRSIVETAERAIAGKVDAIVCRLKELPEEEILQATLPVRQLCAESGTPFVMSHFPSIARELAADAIQIGIADPPLPEVRMQVGSDMRIGYSAHAVTEARDQFALGADYVFLGPIFPTPAKLKYGEPLGLEVVRQAVRDVAGTVVFIGGITQTNLAGLVALGATRVAAIAALQHACDPAQAVAAFRSMLRGEGQGTPS